MPTASLLKDLPPEFAVLRPFLEAASEPYIRIIASDRLPGIRHPQDDPLPRRQSKVGGIPYFPTDLEYPRDENGEALALLVQINCADVPRIPDFEFPKQGILQFYTHPVEPALSPEEDKHCVLYFPETDLAEDALRQDFSFLEVSWEGDSIYSLAFAVDDDPFWQHQYVANQVDEGLLDRFSDWIWDYSYAQQGNRDSVSKLAGRPFLHSDMDDWALDYIAEQAEERGWERPRLLMELIHPDDSDTSFYYFISDADLKACNFKNISMTCVID